MSKPKTKNYCPIPEKDLGIRHWNKYAEPFKFNVVVNDMRDVIKHEDAELLTRSAYGLQSSAAGWGYNLQVPGTRKRL